METLSKMSESQLTNYEKRRVVDYCTLSLAEWEECKTTHRGTEVYFNVKDLTVTWLFNAKDARMGYDFPDPLKYGIHKCMRGLKCIDGVVLCEKCEEVIDI